MTEQEAHQQEQEERQWLEAGCPASEPRPFSDEWMARMRSAENQLQEVLAWTSKRS